MSARHEIEPDEHVIHWYAPIAIGEMRDSPEVNSPNRVPRIKFPETSSGQAGAGYLTIERQL